MRVFFPVSFLFLLLAPMAAADSPCTSLEGLPRSVLPYFEAADQVGWLDLTELRYRTVLTAGRAERRPSTVPPGPCSFTTSFTRADLAVRLLELGSSSIGWVLPAQAAMSRPSGLPARRRWSLLRAVEMDLLHLSEGELDPGGPVNRHQIALALGGLVRFWERDTGMAMAQDLLGLEDVPREHWARDHAEAAVAAHLIPEYRDHLHGAWQVGEADLGMLIGWLAESAMRVSEALPRGTSTERRARLLVFLMGNDLPFAIRVAMSRKPGRRGHR